MGEEEGTKDHRKKKQTTLRRYQHWFQWKQSAG